VNQNAQITTAYAFDKNGSLLRRSHSANPLPSLAGAYFGLITAEDGSMNRITVGAWSLTLGSTGTFTAKGSVLGQSFTFKGAFAADGTTPAITIDPKGAFLGLTLNLTLDVTGATHEITGPATGSGLIAGQLTAARAAYDTKKRPAPAGLAGAYTVLFQPTAPSATVPAGTGLAIGKVDGGGKLTLAGSLANGSKFTATTVLTESEIWPLVFAPKNGGVLSGELAPAPEIGVSDFSGTFRWQKLATTGPLYPAAFDTELDTVGSRYLAPPKKQRVLDFAATVPNARLTASATGIAALDQTLTLSTANKFLIPVTPQKPKLTLTPTTGLLNGSYLDGTALRKFQGVIFQEQNKAAGQVTAPAATGPLLLTRP
jgi:hypothetical protein